MSKAARSPILRRLADARRLAGMTQAQVADKLGVSRPTVGKMEVGAREVGADEMVRWCNALGVAVSDIVIPDGALVRQLDGIADPVVKKRYVQFALASADISEVVAEKLLGGKS